MLDVTRIQYPLAPLAAGTYNNAQGKTIKGVGHTIDFSKPDYFSADDYTQHLYMILGRAKAFKYSLFRNLTETPEGDIDFSILKLAHLRTLPSFWIVWRTLMCFVGLLTPCGLIDPA